MSADVQVRPTEDAWVVAIHAGEGDYKPVGSGVVLDDRRILTCAHVAGSWDRDRQAWAENELRIWVSFPKAEAGDSDRQLPVERIVFPAGAPAREKDLAVVHLAEPPPPSVPAAPLRCPEPGDLVLKSWWAFGFPDEDRIGEFATGQFVSVSALGRIQLGEGSEHPVRRGFSGGGVWSPDYQAVVAVVSQVRGKEGDGRAITLYEADKWFPGENIEGLSALSSAAEAGEAALAAWGWSLSRDREAVRHWRPRGRGVSVDSERGFRFRGRTAALRTIRDWLDREEADPRVLVVTGAPGTGKSAVLGRIVTTSDRAAASQLPDWDMEVRATAASVGCAVHAKGKTALEIATEIARAASAGLPQRIQDFEPALLKKLSGQPDRRFNVIIDALDEAASPAEARTAISKVIRPLAKICAGIGSSVVVGSRRTDADGDLLRSFADSVRLIDLDSAEFFAEEDLAAYALLTLELAGNRRAGNPYADEEIAGPVATRIAELSGQNFLVAGLTARTHGWYDETAVHPATLSFSPTVDGAMREYLRRIPPISVDKSVLAPKIPAETLLTALAFAEAPGLTAGLWRTALRALGGGEVPEDVLTQFARSSAASFLVESSGDDEQGETTFRLFHQALNDALLHARAEEAEPADGERALTRAFLKSGRDAGWERAPAYLLRSLPAHAVRAGILDEILTDPEYLVHVDSDRLAPYLHTATVARSRLFAAVYVASVDTHRSVPADRRRQILALDAARYNDPALLAALNSEIDADAWKPLHATGGKLSPALRNAFVGHTGYVNAVACTMLDGRPVAVTGSKDRTVRVWDLATGQPIGQPLTGHTDEVEAVACTVLDGRPVAVTGSKDRTVRVWDLATGGPVSGPYGLIHAVNAVACTYLDGRPVAIASTRGRKTYILDVADGRPVSEPLACSAWVRALACTTLAGRPVVLTACQDNTAQVWDLTTGRPVGRPVEHDNSVESVACTMLDGRPVAVTSAGGRSVKAWDLATGRAVGKPFAKAGGRRFSWVCRVACITLDDRPVVVTGSSDGSVRVWDLATGQQLGPALREPGRGTVFSLACTVIDGRPVAVTSAGDDDVVRLWDLGLGKHVGQPSAGHADHVRAVACTVIDGRLVAVTASGSTSGPAFGSDYNHVVRVWDLATGQPVGHPFGGHTDDINAIACTVIDGRPVAVTGSRDRSARVWDLATGRPVGQPLLLSDHVDAVECTLIEGRPAAVVAGSQFSTVVWDLRNGRCIRELRGHRAIAIACTELGGRPVAVTGSHDNTAWVWDLITGEPVGKPLAGHGGSVYAVACTVLDGKPVAVTGSKDRTVRVWDLATGRPVGRPLIGHTDGVISVTCAVLNGRPIAITSSDDILGDIFDGPDHTIRIWDLVTFTGEVIDLPAACSSVAAADPHFLVCAFGKDIAVFTHSPPARQDRCSRPQLPGLPLPIGTLSGKHMPVSQSGTSGTSVSESSRTPAPPDRLSHPL